MSRARSRYYQTLQRASRPLRDGKWHPALLGFPIPQHVAGPPHCLHWQPIGLPRLSWGARTAKGFRPNEIGYQRRDRAEVIRAEARVEWLPSENWHIEQITTRGRVPDALASKAVLLIGAGALGSAVAELLVHAGVLRLLIMDDDHLHAGNLCRHTLTLCDLSAPKAQATASRLNAASPHARVEAIAEGFPRTTGQDALRVQQCQVIVDCTGQDDLIHELSSFSWEEPKHFLSLSLGFEARRLFCFAVRSSTFPEQAFHEGLRRG